MCTVRGLIAGVALSCRVQKTKLGHDPIQKKTFGHETEADEDEGEQQKRNQSEDETCCLGGAAAGQQRCGIRNEPAKWPYAAICGARFARRPLP